MKNVILSMMLIVGLAFGLTARKSCGGDDKELTNKCKTCKCGTKERAPSPKSLKAGDECTIGGCPSGKDEKGDKIKMLGIEDVRKIVEEKSALIFDARTGKWDDGERIPGAKSLSADNSQGEIELAIPDKEQAVLVYCGSSKCPASAKLAKLLIKLGYKNVMEYPDGIKGWKDAGMSVEKNK